jgi:hypothetical protein
MTKRPLIASPRWTPEEDDLLRRLAEEGRSPTVIAEQLKRKVAAVDRTKLGLRLHAQELNDVARRGGAEGETETPKREK